MPTRLTFKRRLCASDCHIAKLKKCLWACLDRICLSLRRRRLKSPEGRVQEICEEFLSRLFSEMPQVAGALREPDVQYSLMIAQRDYARCGGGDLRKVLVDLLLGKCRAEPAGLQSIVLAEAIETVRKLPPRAMPTLTAGFLLRNTRADGIVSLDDLRRNISEHLGPLLAGIARDNVLYDHLVYAGCAAYDPVKRNLGELYCQSHPGLFQSGFMASQTSQEVLDEAQEIGLIDHTAYDEHRFEVKVTDLDQLKAFLRRSGKEHLVEPVGGLLKVGLKAGEGADSIIAELSDDGKELLRLWNGTSLWRILPTSVGIAIAHAYWSANCTEDTALDVWIPDR